MGAVGDVGFVGLLGLAYATRSTPQPGDGFSSDSPLIYDSISSSGGIDVAPLTGIITLPANGVYELLLTVSVVVEEPYVTSPLSIGFFETEFASVVRPSRTATPYLPNFSGGTFQVISLTAYETGVAAETLVSCSEGTASSAVLVVRRYA